MKSTLDHALEQLLTFGIDIEVERCDTDAMRADAEDIRNGITPLHLDRLPGRFAADLLDTVADILDARPRPADLRSNDPRMHALSQVLDAARVMADGEAITAYSGLDAAVSAYLNGESADDIIRAADLPMGPA